MKPVLVTGSPTAGRLAELAAVRACLSISRRPDSPTAVVVEFGERPRSATVIATAAVKDLESRIHASPTLPESVRLSARGAVLFVSIRDGEGQGPAGSTLSALLDLLPEGVPVFAVASADRFRELLETETIEWGEVLIRSGPRDTRDPGEADAEGPEPLIELAVDDSRGYANRIAVIDHDPGRLEARKAIAGRVPSVGRSGGSAADGDLPGSEAGHRGRWWRSGVRRRKTASSGESGQATPLVLGAAFVLVLGAIAMVALGGAITGKARGQSAADLAALSAVRSMKNDLPRLMAPPTLPNGAPNPYHMPKPVYLTRARLAATSNAVANGVSPIGISVRFPDAASWAPVRARVAVGVTVWAGEAGGAHRSRPVWAEARLSAPLTMGVVPAMASGGGYSGPLAERQGRGLRPDVAVAFDAMSAAAAGAGVSLAINSAFRSDAEQARLFAANPDPRMVARPGTSLHRCGTELDLGPPGAYGWLAANAGRFGFVQRYSWEAWHYGFTAGPDPCSSAGNHTGSTLAGGRGGEPRHAVNQTLPGFVPARFRRPILAAAMRWNVSAPLLAAQLYAESGFNPGVVSSAGAMGIAQFMPGTAASYGLRDPFDPEAAIMAQGHLMSDLLKQFGSPALALAAYNAGPGAVSPCNCIPPYAETQAYVAKIMAMLGGAGAIAPMPMEIELVA